MKKIFISIIALAVFAGCNTTPIEEVQTALTAPMEVSFDGGSRVFDQNLHWSWQSGDEIAALQYAGGMTINTLSFRDNDTFGTDNFVYATDDPSMFLFVYPSEALNRSNYTLNFVQTGVWTPILVGTANNATVDAIGTVSMVHQSAAFEIRVWDEGRAARKSIKSATITSTKDFLNGGTTATVDGINSDTVVFNLAEGSFDFELTLVATDGATYTVAVPSKTFACGKRTVLNVEWKYPFVEPKLSYNILSSYTNKDNSLDGRSIYVKDIVLTDADSATIELYLNGNKVADMTPGQTTTVSNLALGEYKAQVKWSAKGRDYTSEQTTVYVTGIPYDFTFYESSTESVDAAGWTRNGDTGYMSDLLWISENVGINSNDYGWVASPAIYAPASGIDTNITLVTKFYIAAFSSSASKKYMTVYFGATSNPNSSVKTVSGQAQGSNVTSSTKDLRTLSVSLNIPSGMKYVSIDHNNTTGTVSYFYLYSYSCHYK